MISYNIDVVNAQLRVFDNAIPSCRAFPATEFITYNGTVPGPTVEVPRGHESLIRFNNKVNGTFNNSLVHACNNNGGNEKDNDDDNDNDNDNKSGRPIAIHLHGAASLSVFDGWAEDEICFQESKDYVYPNNMAATLWYHDHALHINTQNVYLGLAG